MPEGIAASAQFDAPWKIGLELFFEPFLVLCFPPLHAQIDWSVAPEFLDKELEKLAPEHAHGAGCVDKLIKVRLQNGQDEWVLVHIEVQAQPESQFGLRMWVYYYRLWDKYRQRVVSLAVLADDDPDWRPRCYHTELAGCIQHFEFPIFKALDCADAEGEFERTGNPFALLVAAHQVALKTRHDAEARAEARFRIVNYLRGRGMPRRRIVDLYRLIGWLTFLPRDLELQFQERLAKFEQREAAMTAETLLAPIELIALERGQQEGWQQGRQQGRQEGRQEGALIGRIQTCQELLGLVVTPMEELAQEETGVLQWRYQALEKELRDRLRRAS